MIRRGRHVCTTQLRQVQLPGLGLVDVALNVAFGTAGQVCGLSSPAPPRDQVEAMLVAQLVRDLNSRITAHGALSVRSLKRQAEALLALLEILEDIEDGLGPEAAAMLREPGP
jgi:hypothetical protein